ncbi:MAG: hypothetical protein HFE97_00340 [Oscillospiraceae bacterium]|nr:hypothetical protein [Oscillospiraceae bacterium]
MLEESIPDLICCRCNLLLEPRKAVFRYLGHDFEVTLPGCPNCGQIYLSEELVNGKIAEVEQTLEDK